MNLRSWTACVVGACILALVLLILAVRSSKRGRLTLEERYLNELGAKQPKITIITLEDRPLSELLAMHNRSAQEYADYHGYEYRYLDRFESPLPIYWKKVHWMSQVLEERAADYVLWLDSDTIIARPRVPLSAIIAQDPEASIYIGRDWPSMPMNTYNAGVFMIRNSETGRRFIAECLESITNNAACLVDDKPALKGAWAGACYEQGVMNKLLSGEFSSHFCHVRPPLISNCTSKLYNALADCLIAHRFGDKDSCVAQFKRYLKQNQQLPVVRNVNPLRICLLLTIYGEPQRSAAYGQVLAQWANHTALPLFVVDSAGVGLFDGNNSSRYQIHQFKQQHSGRSPSVTERDSLFRAAKHFAAEFAGYDLICKVTGKYWVPGLEDALRYVPAGTELLLQHRTDCWGQNTELLAVKPALLVPLLLSVGKHLERNVQQFVKDSSPRLCRLPPLRLEQPVRRSDGSVLNYV
jgi:hypothetical protein